MRQIAIGLLLVCTVAASFYLGRFTAKLDTGLSSEANYPWDLHKKIAELNVDCGKPSNGEKIGDFLVEPVTAIRAVGIVSYDISKHMIQASIVDRNGRFATDSWPLDCQ